MRKGGPAASLQFSEKRHRQVTYVFQLGKKSRAGKQISAVTERQTGQHCSLLSLHLSALYLRPNTVPSRWDTVGAPRDFAPGGQAQARGQANPPAHNSETDWRGARAPGKGTCPEMLEHASPSLPSQLDISPTPENCLPTPRESHSTLRQRSRSPPQDVPAKALNVGHWFPVPTQRGRKPCLRHTARRRRSNSGTPGDSTLR